MKYSLLAALAVVAVLFAALPVTAQTAPPLPVATNLAAPPPSAQPAIPANAPTVPATLPSPIVTPPPLPAPAATPSPNASASPSGKGKKGKNAAAPTPSAPAETPSPPAFASLDGDWEFVQSTPSDDTYSRLILRQTGQSISGTWKITKSKTYPVEGQYDGKAVKFNVTIDGKTWTMNGYVDNASDMVGILRDPAGKQIVFTANHRAPAKQELLIKP